MKIRPGHNIIDEIMLFSRENEQEIRAEFDKMVQYYSTHHEDFINLLVDVKYDLKNKDHFSDILTNGIDKALDNVGSNNWVFNDNMLLTSLDKVNKQFRQIPDNVLLENPEVKIFFYDLADEPDKSGSRLILSRVITNWRNFTALWQSKNN